MSKMLFTPRRNRTIEQRFWEKVKKTDDCWEWLGARSGANGGRYGSFRMGEKTIQTHRLSWELTNGKIPKEICVLHHCDNVICVNPAHLFLGTQKDNSMDMIKKGRSADKTGENAGMAKLTWRKVQRIRRLMGMGGITQVEMGKYYGVKHSTVSNILLQKTWKISC
jgi:hypothetical protein